MGVKSWHLKLGGKPLMLAPATTGGHDIYLSTDPKEPGSTGEIGTIVIPSLHHGLGPYHARDPMTAVYCVGLDLSVPGTVLRSGNATPIKSDSIANWYDSQGGGLAAYPHLGAVDDTRLMAVTAKRLYRIDPATDTVTAVYVLDDTLYAFTGSWVLYRGSLYFAVESNEDGTARGLYGNRLVRYNIASNSFYDYDWIKASVVQAARGGIWWVENKGLTTAPDVYWTDDELFPGDPICVTVKYTGNGTSQNITSFPWQPDVVIVKGNVPEASVLKTDTMAAGQSRTWLSATMLTTAITGFLSSGFSVGAHNAVNKSGMEYVAVGFKKKAGLVDTLTYNGNATDNRDIVTSFSPDLVFVAKGAVGTGVGGVVTRPKTLAGDSTFLLDSTTPIADAIQSLGENKFQVGLDKRVNELPIAYHAVVFKESVRVLELTTYVGDGTDNRLVELGLSPAYCIVKQSDTYLGEPPSVGMQRMVAKSGDWSVAFWDQAFYSLGDCIQNFKPTGIEVGTNGLVNAHSRTYHVMAFGPSTNFTKAGPYPIEPGGYCTGGGIVGHWVVWYKRDGQIYGIDKDGVIAPLVAEGMTSPDMRFGKGGCLYNQNLIIPHKDGCLALDISSLQVADIHPIKVAEAIIPISGRVASCATPFGPRLFMLLGGGACNLVVYDKHSDGDYYSYPNPLYSQQTSGRALATVARSSGAVSVYALLERLTAGIAGHLQIWRVDVSSLGWAVAPDSVYSGGITKTAFHTGYAMASLVTKRFIQVRGWAKDVSATNYFSLGFALDGETSYPSLGSIKANGPFSLPFPPTFLSLGRAVSLEITSAGTTAGKTRLELPLFIDFEYIPTVSDRLRLGVLAASEQLTEFGDIVQQDSADAIVDYLKNLCGKVVPLEWPSGTKWSVLVERVAGQQEEAETIVSGGQTEKVNVWVRRL